MVPEQTFVESLAQHVITRLAARGLTLAGAESLTGGKLADSLVTVPGASHVFLGAVVSYSESAKVAALGVSPDSLRSFTAVSAQVAEEMARGAAALFGADIAVATTGEAGPASATGQPVGTVYWAVLRAGKPPLISHDVFPGTRSDIRLASVAAALESVLRLVP